MGSYFEGYYYKHQNGNQTLCIINGNTDSEEFIQIITNNGSWKIPNGDGCICSEKGIFLDIKTPELSLCGKIFYGKFHPIKYDIMGPFRCFKMECSHGVISMQHDLKGNVLLNGKTMDFTGGKGYIEKDSGRSFPSSYLWAQANQLETRKSENLLSCSEKNCSIMAAAAEIPFCGFHFKGCICVMQYRGKEYRIATYLGARVRYAAKNGLVLQQGKYCLIIKVKSYRAKTLDAPQNGRMTREIYESASCPAEFIFYKGKKKIFHLYTKNASYEYEGLSKKDL